MAANGCHKVDEVGRIVDFSLIKKRMLGWLDDHWDHAFLIYEKDENALAAIQVVEPVKYFVMPHNPTAENMARYLLEVVSPYVLSDLGVIARQVSLWETTEACAVATRSEHSVANVPVVPGVAVVKDSRNSVVS